MQSFTKRLATPDPAFRPEFFFNKIYTVAGVRYHVSVQDKDRQSYFFIMENRNGAWKIINAPQVPQWILDAEKQLEQCIVEHKLVK
jgi:hypothetical protein